MLLNAINLVLAQVIIAVLSFQLLASMSYLHETLTMRAGSVGQVGNVDDCAAGDYSRPSTCLGYTRILAVSNVMARFTQHSECAVRIRSTAIQFAIAYEYIVLQYSSTNSWCSSAWLARH